MDATDRRRILALWNGKSGNSSIREQVADRLRALAAHGFDVDQQEPSSAEEAADVAAEVAEETIVVAAGGDGTVHAVAQGLLRRHVGEPSGDKARPDDGAEASAGPALAILPLGTANDLARSLAIPLDPFEAVETLKDPIVRRIDTVRVAVNGDPQWMLNAAAGGNGAEVAWRLDREKKQQWGIWCYVPSVVDVAKNLQRYRLRLHLDDETTSEVDAVALIVANGQTTATIEVAARASLEDATLDVIAIKDGSLLDTASVAAQFLAGDYLQHEQVFHRRTRTLRLECDQNIRFSIDGESHVAQSLAFALHPAALPVVVGDGYAKA